MDNTGAGRPVIIKRKKVVAAGGHPGGAWKVAYADFVTAMMAFFLLMWLLSVTDDQTKLALADYFSPTIPIHSSTGGGDGPFFGSSVFDQDVLTRDETGQEGDPERKDVVGTPDNSLMEIEKTLMDAGSGDAAEADPLLKHIRTRVTDEGLIIDVFDVEDSPLFDANGVEAQPILEQLLGMIGRVVARTQNPVAVTGHLAAGDVAENLDLWQLSTKRADVSRTLLVAAGVDDARLARVTGKADRSPAAPDASDSRNRRIEITLLRRFEP